jgi:hypothetical protein
LEANNKNVKAVLNQLPGGSQRREGSNAHLRLVQGLKKCIVIGRVSRPALTCRSFQGVSFAFGTHLEPIQKELELPYLERPEIRCIDVSTSTA